MAIWQVTTSQKSDLIIPNNIFNTWSTLVDPATQAVIEKEIIDINPGWNYFLFDDQSQVEFIATHFDQQVIDAYSYIIPGAYKADFFRYCVLYIQGGVYLDLGIRTPRPLAELIKTLNVPFISVRDRRKHRVYQAILCAQAKHPFLKATIDLITQHAHSGFYGKTDLDPTGPGAIGKAINQVLGHRANRPLAIGYQGKGPHRFYLLPFYKTLDNECPIYLDDKTPVFSAKKRFNIESSAKKEINYHFCWENDRVYTHDKVQRRWYNPPLGLLRRLYHAGDKQKARQTLKKFLLSGYFNFQLVLVVIRGELKKK